MFVQFLTIISSVAHFDFLIFPEKCQEAAACVLASVFVDCISETQHSIVPIALLVSSVCYYDLGLYNYAVKYKQLHQVKMAINILSWINLISAAHNPTLSWYRDFVTVLHYSTILIWTCGF